MRILFVGDGRSPTLINWLDYWLRKGEEVHLISTYPCQPVPGITSLHILAIAFGSFARRRTPKIHQKEQNHYLNNARLRDSLRRLRYILGPVSLPFQYGRYLRLVKEIQPDIVHALRIPFEGMLAWKTPDSVPLIISTWGNDFTLHANGSFLMARLTRQTLQRANGLICDTMRDLRLAVEWGYSTGKPTMVIPGSGGIHMERMDKDSPVDELPEDLPDVPVIVNPRGQRPGSLRQDIFFAAIPKVLREIPQALFICPSLRGDVQAERAVDQFDIRERTWLWPRLNQAQLWTLFRKSVVFVSPSIHDGTPNSMLETMASGCFPIVGNIESMREWISNGVNGSLVDSNDPASIAEAIVQAINQPTLRERAAKINAALIAERAAYLPNMARVELFYQNLIKSKESEAIL